MSTISFGLGDKSEDEIRRDAAVNTLERMGYTWAGGWRWYPPSDKAQTAAAPVSDDNPMATNQRGGLFFADMGEEEAAPVAVPLKMSDEELDRIIDLQHFRLAEPYLTATFRVDLPELRNLIRCGEHHGRVAIAGAPQHLWMETAAMMSRDAEFHRGIVHQIGEMFGDAARTADDGFPLADDVLPLKVPKLVRALLDAQNALPLSKQAVEDAVASWTDDERLELFSSYCSHCGRDDAFCQCWNDE